MFIYGGNIYGSKILYLFIIKMINKRSRKVRENKFDVKRKEIRKIFMEKKKTQIYLYIISNRLSHI